MIKQLIPRMTEICGPEGVLAGRDEALTYECDAYTIRKDLPEVVVLPTATEQVAAVVRLCHEQGVPFVGRGAGTGLSGGALALNGGVIISLTRTMSPRSRLRKRARRLV